MEEKKTISIMDRVKAYADKVRSDGWKKHRFEDAHDFCDFVGSRLNRLPEYVQAVARYDNTVTLAYATMEGQDLRDRVESADRSRRMAHDCAIDAINILNRAFDSAGVEPFADIDTKDRSAVADFAGRFTIEAFDRQLYGEDRAMDRAVKNLQAGSRYSAKMQQIMSSVLNDTPDSKPKTDTEISK